jgi:peptidoglycan/xylan/chitin deacetylase (PgdA/CDA1 family)
MKRALSASVALAGAGVGAAHALPAAAFLTPVRRFMPGLSGVGDPGHAALTFDDGPHPRSTPLFLRLLETHGVRATFFLLGSELVRCPRLGQDIVAAGHEVAVHGWEHRCLLTLGPRATYDTLARTRDVVGDITGQRPRWFRAPYGVFSGPSLATARKLGLTPILWTCWGFDWTASSTGPSVLKTVLRGLKGGGTILLHDSDVAASPGAWQSTLSALPPLFEECQHRGLRLGPLAEHAVRSSGPGSTVDGESTVDGNTSPTPARPLATPHAAPAHLPR